MVAQTCHSSYGRKLKLEGSQSRLVWGKSKTLSPKIDIETWDGSVAQEHLPRKDEALSSNLSAKKNPIGIF